MAGAHPIVKILMSSIFGFIVGFMLMTAMRNQEHISWAAGRVRSYNEKLIGSMVSSISENKKNDMEFNVNNNMDMDEQDGQEGDDDNDDSEDDSTENDAVEAEVLTNEPTTSPVVTQSPTPLPPILQCPASIPLVSDTVASTILKPLPLTNTLTTPKTVSKEKIFYDLNIENLPAFYMYDDEMGTVDTKLLLGCLQHILGVKPKQGSDMIDLGELVLAANMQQGAGKYLGDAIILDSLKRHPSRVYDKHAATFFIVPFSPILSYMMPPNPSSYGCKLERPTHITRMSAIVNKLKSFDTFKKANGYDHVLFCSGCSPLIITPDLSKQMTNMLIVGTKPEVAQRFGGKKDQPINPHIFIPDLTTRMLMGKSQGQFNIPTPINKRDAYYFLLDVTVNMAWHEDFFNQLGTMIPRPFININRLDDATRSLFFLRSDYSRSHMMAESRFCIILVIAGGNYARLFDAMADGCVPILIGSASSLMDKLPFSNIINWKEVVIFIDGLGMLFLSFYLRFFLLISLIYMMMIVIQ